MKIVIEANENKEPPFHISFRWDETEPSAKFLAETLLIFSNHPEIFNKMIPVFYEEFGEEKALLILKLFGLMSINASKASASNVLAAEIPIIPIMGIKGGMTG